MKKKKNRYRKYLDGVNGGLVRDERGQETLVAQLADVAGHVPSIDEDLQIARTGRRPVD